MALETISANGVLIIDRSLNMTDLVAGMLRTLGRKDIRSVTDITLALAELERRPYAIILIDDQYGQIDTVKFVASLRRAVDNQNRLTPIIMMSAAPDAARISAARDAGVNEFLRKPFAVEHLKSRITSITEAPREIIATPAYVGPDRRRHGAADLGENDRRGKHETVPG